jgi:hypothetical protein
MQDQNNPEQPYNPFASLDANKTETSSEATKSAEVTILPDNGTGLIIPQGNETIIFRKQFAPEIISQIETVKTELSTLPPVVDQLSMDNTNTVLKKAKKLITSVGTDRKQMTAILDQKKDEIMAVERQIIFDLETITKKINDQVTLFLVAEKKKEQEKEEAIRKQKAKELEEQQKEIDRVARIKNLILQFKGNVLNAIATSTFENIDQRIAQLDQVQLNEASYMEFLGEAQIMYEECKKLFQGKKIDLMRIEEAGKKNADEAERLRKESEAKTKLQEDKQKQEQFLVQNDKMEAEMNANGQNQMETELHISINKGVKGGMGRWTFSEEIDMKLLPEEYKTFDADKIKAAVKAGERDIPGVKIFQKISNVSR